MKTFLVIGLGESGLAATNLLLFYGYYVVGVDKTNLHNKKKEDRFEFFLEDEFNDFARIDSVVVSPGVHPAHPLYKKALKENKEVISEAELGMRYLKTRCIGVTGSNGKTTQTLFLTHLFLEAGIKAVCIGNVGYPISAYALNQKDEEICVIELSSYQLERSFSKVLDVAILLDITPDHMDRYSTLDEYAEAKFRIFSLVKNQGRALVSDSTYRKFQTRLHQLRYLLELSPNTFEGENKNCYLQLTKNKEYCDFLPAIREKALGFLCFYFAYECAKIFGISQNFLHQAIKTFKKPEHRCEVIDEINGITFINDSKATNVESVIYAVNLIENPIYLIAGGRDKNLDFSLWNESFKDKVKQVFVIGEASEKIHGALSPNLPVTLCQNLKEALIAAAMIAREKATILLSPGCASFDQFRDYKHRGECFKEYVMALKKGCLR